MEVIHMPKGKGRGWHGDADGHRKAGKRGGLATARTHDSKFYSEIGSKGGKASTGNFKNNPERARIAGQKGGRA
jgi:general stress protein YciG